MFYGEVIDKTKLKFRIYIPFGSNVQLLNKCVESIVTRIGAFSSEEKPICILNNTMVSVKDALNHYDKCIELMPPIDLQPAQEANWLIRLARENGEVFACELHTDAELVDGSLEDLIEKYHEVKGTKWAQILQFGSGVFGAFNPEFFYSENVWYDAFMFPFYFCDNHMNRVMTSRGWTVEHTRRCADGLLIHKSSHYLKDDPIFRRKNELAFRHHGALYADIWGGLPGSETVATDPTANGTLELKREV
jgi:hypothetical protein